MNDETSNVWMIWELFEEKKNVYRIERNVPLNSRLTTMIQWQWWFSSSAHTQREYIIKWTLRAFSLLRFPSLLAVSLFALGSHYAEGKPGTISAKVFEEKKPNLRTKFLNYTTSNITNSFFRYCNWCTF